jgi:hypothetical protein
VLSALPGTDLHTNSFAQSTVWSDTKPRGCSWFRHSKSGSTSPDVTDGKRLRVHIIKRFGDRLLACQDGAVTYDCTRAVMRKISVKVNVNDRMQRGYSYILTEPVGRNFDPEFCPELTPKQMLTLGVFCGKYMTDCRKEFPASWFANARLSSCGRDCSLNYFGVDASQPLSVWRKKGWIHPDDPRGWFQWYCRYYMGRRMSIEDARQIRRWKAIRRHVAQIRQHCEPGDPTCRPRQRQALLHWAYHSRKI